MKQTFIATPPVFNTQKYVAPVPITGKALLEESALVAASYGYATQHGGRQTKEILRQIAQLYEHQIRRATDHNCAPVVDVRTHRLTHEQYPAIPGWHCDNVPRDAHKGQPNFEACNPHAFHVCVLLSDQRAGVSNTEFVMAPIRPQLYDEMRVYKNLHQEVQRIKPPTAVAKDGVFTFFTQKTVHRASPCHQRGVRMFLRFSMVEKPIFANVVPEQQQVYILTEENGW